MTAGCVALTYFLVKNLPDKHKSVASLSADTGAVAEYFTSSQERANTWQQLNRIVEMMQTKREIDGLSFRLIIHDLSDSTQAFRPYSDQIRSLSAVERDTLMQQYMQLLNNRAVLAPSEAGMSRLWDIVASMQYDNKSLLKNLTFTLREDVRYIEVEFESQNPDLSAFVVNTFSSDFVYQFNNRLRSSNQESVVLLDSILREKESEMNRKNAMLAQYRSTTGGTNGSSQSSILFQQIMSYENQGSEVRRRIASLKGAIARITEKLNDPTDSDIGGQVGNSNNSLVQLGRQLEEANRRYVDNGFNAQDKRVVDSLQALRARLASGAVSTGGALNASANRQRLITERMELETQLALTESSVTSIQNEINALRNRYNAQVPADIGAQTVLRDADFATKEYTDALNRYNQAKNERLAGVRLNIVEMGLPGLPETSKRNMYVGLSGMAGFSVCFAILFLTFLLDRRIFTPDQLKAATGRSVIGSVNFIANDERDLRDIWADEGQIKEYSIYKDLIRSLRFELDIHLSEGAKVLGITSLRPHEGRTFLASSLAYAFALTGKKVLLISEHSTDLLSLISNKGKSQLQNFETFIVKKQIQTEDLITVLCKNTTHNSLLEMKDAKSLIAGFDILKGEFDVILIDAENLHNFNGAKEWLMFTDKCFAVMESGNIISEKEQQFINYLNQKEGFVGWVLNKVKLT